MNTDERQIPWTDGNYLEYDAYCPKCSEVLSLIEYTGTSNYSPQGPDYHFQACFTYELCNHCGYKLYHQPLPLEMLAKGEQP